MASEFIISPALNQASEAPLPSASDKVSEAFSLSTSATYYLRNLYTKRYACVRGNDIEPVATRDETSLFFKWKFVPAGILHYVANVGSKDYCAPDRSRLQNTYTPLIMQSDVFVVTINPNTDDSSLMNLSFYAHGNRYYMTDTDQSILYAVTDEYKDPANPTFNDKRRTQWILERVP